MIHMIDMCASKLRPLLDLANIVPGDFSPGDTRQQDLSFLLELLKKKAEKGAIKRFPRPSLYANWRREDFPLHSLHPTPPQAK